MTQGDSSRRPGWREALTRFGFALPLPVKRAARRMLHVADGMVGRLAGEFCAVCGGHHLTVPRRIYWPELVAEWGLTPEWEAWLNEREGTACAACGCSLRSRHLAAALVRVADEALGLEARSLRELCRDPRLTPWNVAEINSAGQLHPELAALPRLSYSEYASPDPAVRREDLLRLTYPDSSFDLVITSETLEHVPDVRRCLSEIHRVLVPGGWHVFTVPLLWDREHTVVRARLTPDGNVEHLLPPSHHQPPSEQTGDYLVFYEYGRDFPDWVREAGFHVDVDRHPRNPAVLTLVTRKPVA